MVAHCGYRNITVETVWDQNAAGKLLGSDMFWQKTGTRETRSKYPAALQHKHIFPPMSLVYSACEWSKSVTSSVEKLQISVLLNDELFLPADFLRNTNLHRLWFLEVEKSTESVPRYRLWSLPCGGGMFKACNCIQSHRFCHHSQGLALSCLAQIFG